jgi:hypothetical protein
MRVGAGNPAEVAPLPLPTLVTKNVIACCACAGPAMASPVNATAAKSGSPDVMKILPIRLITLGSVRAYSKQRVDNLAPVRWWNQRSG